MFVLGPRADLNLTLLGGEGCAPGPAGRLAGGLHVSHGSLFQRCEVPMTDWAWLLMVA